MSRFDDTQIPVYYTTPAWKRLRERVLKRDKRRCFYCGGRATTADHVTPRGWGGADLPKNLVACCMICNAVAGGKNFRSREAKKTWITRELKKRTKSVRGEPSFDRSHYEETMRLLRLKRRR